MELLKKYEGNKFIRALIQLVPFGIGSSVDVLIELKIKELKEKRLQTFLEEIEEQLENYSLEILDSENFLHCYLITIQSVLKTRREEKIRLFANYFANAISTNFFESIDEYEELLSILDELSFKEIQLLNVLSKFEENHPFEEKKSKITTIEEYWDDFKKEISTQFQHSEDYIQSLILRLTRSGFLIPFIAEDTPKSDSLDVAGKSYEIETVTVSTGEPIYRLNSLYYKFKAVLNKVPC